MSVSIDIQRGTVDYVPTSVINYLRVCNPQDFDTSLITNVMLVVTVTGNAPRGVKSAEAFLWPLINRRLKLEIDDPAPVIAVFTRVRLSNVPLYNDEHYVWHNTLLTPAYLHFYCVNCTHSVVFHQQGRCLFDATSLHMRYLDDMHTAVVFTLDEERLSFPEFVARTQR